MLSDLKIMSGFFVNYKKILAHPGLMSIAEGTSAKDWCKTRFPSLESYQACSSSKIDRLVKILKHHLGEENNDAEPLFYGRDGTRCPPPTNLAHRLVSGGLSGAEQLDPDVAGNAAAPVPSPRKARQGTVAPAASGPQKRRKIIVYCHLEQTWVLVAHVSPHIRLRAGTLTVSCA